jgi:Protein of unknown function (DUF3810)
VKYSRFALGPIAVLLALAAAFAPIPSTVIERWYSRGAYLRVQPVITSVSDVTPIALLDLFAATLLVWLAVLFIRRWRAGGFLAASGRTLITVIVVSAVIYLWFLSLWGLNYRRVPLEQKVVYDESRISRDQALKLGRIAVERVNALQAASSTASEAEDQLTDAFAAVQRELGATKLARPGRPKRSVLTRYFRKAAIDGMTDPLFLEVIVNSDLLPFERPFVLAHEWSHLAGYNDESEANFVAWLTCVRASSRARYSGWLSAYEHVAASLPRDDRRSLNALLAPAVTADIAASQQRLAASSPALSTAARGAYDKYLRANRIEEGIASYNAVVRLMLGTSFDPSWKPKLRQ